MPGVSKGGGSRAGAAGVQRPFGLLLLVLFLQEQEKNEENDGKINDHLSYEKKNRTVRLAMKKPTKSANSAAGTAYRVLDIPAAPK